MRPTTIVTLIVGALLALGAGALGVYLFVNRSSGKLWFYWIAPLLAIGVALMLLNMTIQYYMKVGRLEARGRPRAQ